MDGEKSEGTLISTLSTSSLDDDEVVEVLLELVLLLVDKEAAKVRPTQRKAVSKFNFIFGFNCNYEENFFF